MPTNTDLVTDLPADFEVFGQAVDTSMADLKGGTTGQILSKASATDMDFTWITNDQGDITGVTATSPLTGGGTSGAITVGIQDASTTQKGSVQLSDSTATTSSVLASTPTATKSAYDLAASAYAPAFSNNFYAGKNKFINGDFGINQRVFTSTATSNVYGFDRWKSLQSGGTSTYSAQTFTVGAAPVAGYEAKNYARIVTSGQSAAGDYSTFDQAIESVRTFAGQTATISFWAKAATGTPKIAVSASQNFGSGGSPSSTVITYGGQVTLTTSWARYSVTVAIPSISGKTLGTTAGTDYLEMLFWVSAGSTYNAYTGSMGIQNNTFDFWGAQIEAGSTVTPFQTASGSIQGELAMCQRYYYQWQASNAYSPFATGFTSTTSTALLYKAFPVPMRIVPTVTTTGTAANYGIQNATNGRVACSAVPALNQGNTDGANIDFTTAAVLTAGAGITGNAQNTTSAYIGFSAEL